MPLAELGDVVLHYKVRGNGPPVIGIMGFGLDQRFWAGQIPTVTADHSFITFDNRGTGASTGGPGSSIKTMADDAARLLEHLGHESAVVMGVSMGGAVAQRLALDHAARVSGLVLAMTWARPVEFMRRQHQLARLLIDCGGPAALLEATMVRMFTPRFFELGAGAIEQMMRAFDGNSPPPEEILDAQLDAIAGHDVLAELHRVTCPTLVVGGRMDMIVPFFASEEIAAAIPGARLVAFASGHGLMVEEMDRFNVELGNFLSRLRAFG
jgi:aminoacrylate hydrolase